MEEFSGSTKITLSQFWLVTGPMTAVITLLAVFTITWKRPNIVYLRASLGDYLSWHLKKSLSRLQMHSPQVQASIRLNSQEQTPPV